MAETGAAAGATVQSMTGYAAAERSAGGTTLRMRLRSVNHRYLDLQLRLPAELDAAQGKLEQRLKAAIGRGHVELTVTVER
ncbi:MAG: YicC/YloC family endoribonuclease, partial [Terriglobales bacterium]